MYTRTCSDGGEHRLRCKSMYGEGAKTNMLN